MKCKLCGKEINERESHNGQPLVDGRVCGNCNSKVILERLKLLRSRENKSDKPAKESLAVTGTDGPISEIDPIKDFEEQAKKFEETFILGKSPVGGQTSKNGVKVSKGQFTGEVSSKGDLEKLDQVNPIKTEKDLESNKIKKSAREGLDRRDWQILFNICKQYGIETFGDLERLFKEYPSDTPISSLLEYAEEVGFDFKRKDE